MSQKNYDFPLLLAVLGLSFFGLAMIASVSVYESYNTFQDNAFYFWRRVSHMIIALSGFFFCLITPYKFWEKISLPILLGSVMLLLMVFSSFGANYGGANRWIDIPLLPSMQPVEFAKFGLIVYIAHWMAQNRHELKHFHYGFIPFIVILCSVVIPLAMQPDFGSILIISLTAVSVFLVAGGSVIQVALGGVFAALLASIVIFQVDYIYNRFFTFFNPESDALGISYQIQNALTAIGSGGIFGLGFGQSIQKNGYLPEVQGDTIFAAIGEELGFVRTALFILTYSFIAWRGYDVARSSKDWFAKLICTGFITAMTVQMLINVSVNLAIFPNTGITLPLISYGGNSLLVTMMSMGIVLNISKHGSKLQINHNRKQRARRFKTHSRKSLLKRVIS